MRTHDEHVQLLCTAGLDGVEPRGVTVAADVMAVHHPHAELLDRHRLRVVVERI